MLNGRTGHLEDQFLTTEVIVSSPAVPRYTSYIDIKYKMVSIINAIQDEELTSSLLFIKDQATRLKVLVYHPEEIDVMFA